MIQSKTIYLNWSDFSTDSGITNISIQTNNSTGRISVPTQEPQTIQFKSYIKCFNLIGLYTDPINQFQYIINQLFWIIGRLNQNWFDLELGLIQGGLRFNCKIGFGLKLGLGLISFK